MNNNENDNPLKNANEPVRGQGENTEVIEPKSTSTLWFNKEERTRINELIVLLEPCIKGEFKQYWDELCEKLHAEKKKFKPRTYFFPGEIIEKVKRQVGKKGEQYGKVFYFIKLRVDGGDRREVDFWVYDDVLDNREQDWPAIEKATLGERYEFEAQKWGKTDYHLRALVKL